MLEFIACYVNIIYIYLYFSILNFILFCFAVCDVNVMHGRKRESRNLA